MSKDIEKAIEIPTHAVYIDEKSSLILGNSELQDTRFKDLGTDSCKEVEEHIAFIRKFLEAHMRFGTPTIQIWEQLESFATAFNTTIVLTFEKDSVNITSRNDFGEVINLNGECSYPLSIGKLTSLNAISSSVSQKQLSLSEAETAINELLKPPSPIGHPLRRICSFLCSFLICGILFKGGFSDMLAAGISGALVTISYDYGVEGFSFIAFISACFAFLARPLANNYHQFWHFWAIVPSALIIFVPSFEVLIGSVRVAGNGKPSAIMKVVAGIARYPYMLMMMTLGSDMYHLIFKGSRATSLLWDATINTSSDPWYRQPLPWWSVFISIPLFAFCVSIIHQHPAFSKNNLTMVISMSIAFLAARVAGMLMKFGVMELDCVNYAFATVSLVMALFYSPTTHGKTTFLAIYSVIIALLMEWFGANATSEKIEEGAFFGSAVIPIIYMSIGFIFGTVLKNKTSYYILGQKEGQPLRS